MNSHLDAGDGLQYADSNEYLRWAKASPQFHSHFGEEQATPAHRHCVPHEPATTFIRGLQPVLQGPVTEDPRPASCDLIACCIGL